jgi:hypothetical protein
MKAISEAKTPEERKRLEGVLGRFNRGIHGGGLFKGDAMTKFMAAAGLSGAAAEGLQEAYGGYQNWRNATAEFGDKLKKAQGDEAFAGLDERTTDYKRGEDRQAAKRAQLALINVGGAGLGMLQDYSAKDLLEQEDMQENLDILLPDLKGKGERQLQVAARMFGSREKVEGLTTEKQQAAAGSIATIFQKYDEQQVAKAYGNADGKRLTGVLRIIDSGGRQLHVVNMNAQEE